MFNSKSKVCTDDLLARDGWCCSYCGDFLALENMTVDHVIPTRRGGPDTMENTVISCLACNASKSDMGVYLFNHYLIIRRYAFEVAPNEMIVYEPIAIETRGELTTIIALPALWAGVHYIPEDQSVLWQSRGAHIVKFAYKETRHDIVLISGTLYDYFTSRKFGCDAR